MKLVRFTFRGDKWNAYLIPEDESTDFFEDEETAGQVEFEKKEVYFNENNIDLDVILHELFHIARGYQYVQDSSLTFDQAEELFCNIFAYEGPALLKLGTDLEKILARLKKAKEDELILEV